MKKQPPSKKKSASAAKTKSQSTMSSTVAKKGKGKITFAQLRTFNLVMAALHAVQGVAVVLLSQASTLPVTINFLTIDTLSSSAAGRPVLVPATKTLFDINLAYVVATFFFLSAIAHLVIATVYRRRYEADLKIGVNKARWIEYGLSASTMMVAIGFLSGIYDLSALIMIFALDLLMNLMGLVMEVHNQTTKKTNWLSYIIGCIAGFVPWLVFGIYVWGASVHGTGNVPTFVYWIYGSIFVFFNCFAINMYLQYKRKGKWADYLYGERTYIVLSLVAKTALAWQVFAGTLRP